MTAPVALLDGRPVTAAELDALVAEHVFRPSGSVCGRVEYRAVRRDEPGPLSERAMALWGFHRGEVAEFVAKYASAYEVAEVVVYPRFSTDIAAAWSVVTKLAKVPGMAEMTWAWGGKALGREWHVRFQGMTRSAHAPDISLAIALAALLAAGACKTATAILPDCVRPGGGA